MAVLNFKDWQLRSCEGPAAAQLDHRSRQIAVTGDIPEGYSWDLLVMAPSGAADVWSLTAVGDGLAVVVTRGMVPEEGRYAVQLRGTLQSDNDTQRHTNIVQLRVLPSITAGGKWPVLPTEFSQAEARLRDIAAHPPIPGNGVWQLWNSDTGAYEDSELPLPSGADGITPHIGDNGNWYLGNEDTGVAAKGAKGDTGAQGPKGDPGAKGDTGAQGPKGDPGSKGDTGAQGPKGDDGTKGDTGATGADGVTPHIGDNGNWYIGSTDTGKPSRGAAGAQGPKGATGPAGPQGPAGATGPQGPAGHSPVVTATKSGKVTTIEVDGTAIAAVNDGADAEDTRVLAVAIPAVVRVLTGSEFNIYYANVISQQNAMFWCSAANGLTIKRYGDHLSITANAPGTYPLQWKVYDSGYSLLASGTCTIIAAANKAVTASALVIGDSTVTQGGYICQKLLSCFSAAGGALTLLGTRGTAPARHEGRAGWKASDYCTKAADGTYTNPFYNNGFDFSHYMTTQAYTGVGVVVLQLGINDIFYAGLDSFSAAATIGYLDTMVNSILNYDSSIKVIVDLLTPPNGNPSVFTEKYGTGQIDFVYRMNTIRMSKALMEHFSGNISVAISPNNCVLDPAQDINDGVHPTEGGYAKLGQMIYETMLGVHSGDSGGGQVAPLWDMTGRTGVQWPEYSDGTVGRSFGTDKYYYPLSFSGTTQRPTAATMTDFAVGTDTLEFTIQTGSASASQLSGYGIVVPLALEAGKSYTFAAKCASANSGVNLMTYNVSGGVWTYVSNARVCYSTTELCSASITPEAGKGYAICFSQKSGGVGTKNVFSQISLKEA